MSEEVLEETPLIDPPVESVDNLEVKNEENEELESQSIINNEENEEDIDEPLPEFNTELAQEKIFELIQSIRSEKGLLELLISSKPISRTACNNYSSTFIFQTESNLEEQLKSSIKEEFANDASKFNDTLLSPSATHIFFSFDTCYIQNNNEKQVSITFYSGVFFSYIRIEQPGPLIDGKVVLIGTTLSEKYLPSVVIVEKVNEDEVSNITSSEEVLSLVSSDLILTPSDTGNDIMIPIELAEDVIANKPKLQIKVFILEKQALEEYEKNEESLSTVLLSPEVLSSMILSNCVNIVYPEVSHIEVLNKFEEIPSMNEFIEENNLNLNKKVINYIKDIHLAVDYDEIVSLQSEGCELICSQITPEGIVEADHMWKFHVLVSYGQYCPGSVDSKPSSSRLSISSTDEKDEKDVHIGVEDIMWIKCLKTLGTVPSMPMYNVYYDYDLSGPDEDYSVYLAVKKGPFLNVRKLMMVCCQGDDENIYMDYIKSLNGVYREAPKEIDSDDPENNRYGIFLVTDPDYNKGKMSASSDSDFQLKTSSENLDFNPSTADDDGTGFEDDEDDDDDEEEDEENEEQILFSLKQQVLELENEKKNLLHINTELQKKAYSLFNREKNQNNNNRQSNALSMMDSSNQNANNEDANINNASSAVLLENNQEKEKQYQDTLLLIIEERNKLNKQLKEFDQLAQDLQTRLDDKEYKVKNISTTFKNFKREVLSKAENSRTGQPIPKATIHQLELKEAQREEELEKCRLRHISLKIMQKKLEKTLRAREQLAEGLHMIDFEQLKIENQTLNEKIEERNEELNKLKRKKTTTVQILTHIREKLNYLNKENLIFVKNNNELDEVILNLRNNLTRIKLERDSIRLENKEWKTKQGFSTSELLLLDFDKQKVKFDELSAYINELKNRYQLLSKQSQVFSIQNSTISNNSISRNYK